MVIGSGSRSLPGFKVNWGCGQLLALDNQRGVVARPIRVEDAGAVYHVTARGNERKAICRDNADRLRFLETVEEAVTRFGVLVPGYWLSNRWSHNRQTVASRFGSACVREASGCPRATRSPKTTTNKHGVLTKPPGQSYSRRAVGGRSKRTAGRARRIRVIRRCCDWCWPRWASSR